MTEIHITWKQRAVPVGRRLARQAVLRNVWLMPCWMRFLSTSDSPLFESNGAFSSSSSMISIVEDVLVSMATN